MSTAAKLAVAGILFVAATAYLAYQGAAGSWQYYLTAEECLSDSASLAGSRLRVAGQVASGSLQIEADRTQARFSLGATARALPVVCRGLLPDNLAEGMEVLVEGRLDDSGSLQSEKVLTRCAGKYERKKGSASANASTALASEAIP
jgi:cytochrome c-type biogenesis protein CcmE